jgi:LAS superfamily LD-carboxypeptidase LdcB
LAPDFDILTGRTDRHVALLADGKSRLHAEALSDFARLSREAAAAGFQLRVVSSFRDFAGQLKIWNDKAEGKRALLDDEGKPLEYSKLSAEEIVFAILRWSALPGASRHHWGTDFDVVAANLIPEGYQVQLTPQEIAPGGPFETFGEWLGKTLPRFGFYRPYAEERGGVSPEWWHLSYSPLSEVFRRAYTKETLRRSVEASDLRLKEIVVSHLDDIFETYVDNVTDPA